MANLDHNHLLFFQSQQKDECYVVLFFIVRILIQQKDNCVSDFMQQHRHAETNQKI